MPRQEGVEAGEAVGDQRVATGRGLFESDGLGIH